MPYRPPIHQPMHKTTRRPPDNRPSPSARGYDRRWQRFRLWYLRRNPICLECGGIASEVHHVTPLAKAPEGKFDLNNLAALCKRCHSRHTAKASF